MRDCVMLHYVLCTVCVHMMRCINSGHWDGGFWHWVQDSISIYMSRVKSALVYVLRVRGDGEGKTHCVKDVDTSTMIAKGANDNDITRVAIRFIDS